MNQQEKPQSTQQNRAQESQTQNPSRMQRNQESSSGESQGIQRNQAGGMERRSQGSGNYPSIFSVSPGEFFTMSPITLMRRFTEDIDRAFGLAGERGSAELAGQEPGWVPRIEVRQSGDNLVVHAELPGLSEKDVRLEATDEGLLIQGERRREQESNEGGWHHSEFSYGQFSRLIPLPENAKIDQARANFRNGVLEVTVPVPEAENKRRQIPIGASGETQGAQQTSTSGTASGAQGSKAASAGR